ncbi:MAG: hypothetical protein ABFS05_01940 [Bacteroidota bacterium]
MTDKIRYVRDIQIIKSKEDPGLILIKAKGIAEISELIVPVFVPGENKNLAEDGVYELEFKLNPPGGKKLTLEVEMETELRIKNLPHNIKAIKIIASENSDIELL